MSARPRTLTVAAGLQAAEGLAALVFGLFVGWEAVFGTPLETGGAFGVAVLGILGGAGMLVVARGLLRLRRWGRAPALVTQLLAIFVAWNLIQSDQFGYGLPLAACAIAAAVLLLSRPSTQALYENPR
ncbi:MAG TPA: hypothetical protein VFU43_26800 [Streptosporangiaceae bacterium]|nr:hypothetical protein [Streptosporangiaceae bacterium]